MINSKRLPQFPVGTGGTTSFFDLNAIPNAAIEGAEILKDGATTTYGADAVAGVVNIKLRKEYRGAEATVEYGNTLDKDAGQFTADVIFGIGDDKTQVTGVMKVDRRNSVFNRDRGFSARPFFLSSNTSPDNLQVSSAVAAAAGGQNLNPGGIEFNPPDFTNGLAPASSYIYSQGSCCAEVSFLVLTTTSSPAHFRNRNVTAVISQATTSGLAIKLSFMATSFTRK